MFSNVYEDVPENIQSVVASLVSDDYHRTHERRMARVVQLIHENVTHGRLLELGTSELIPIALGQLVPELSVDVTEFDLTLPATGVMQLSMGGHDRTCTVFRVDLETQQIPVPDETYDYVLCSEVIEHMEVDPMFMLVEINRVLKPNGLLFLTTPNITSTRGIYKILRGYEPYFYMQYRHKPVLYRHNYEYALPTLRRVLVEAGFRGKLWTEDTFEDPVHDDVPTLRSLGYTLDTVGDNIFAVVEKEFNVLNRYPDVLYAD